MDDYDDFNMSVAEYYNDLFYDDCDDYYEEDMENMYPREEDQY